MSKYNPKIRPDLSVFVDHKVRVRLVHGPSVVGTLAGYDLFMNLVLTQAAELVSGEPLEDSAVLRPIGSTVTQPPRARSHPRRRLSGRCLSSRHHARSRPPALAQALPTHLRPPTPCSGHPRPKCCGP